MKRRVLAAPFVITTALAGCSSEGVVNLTTEPPVTSEPTSTTPDTDPIVVVNATVPPTEVATIPAPMETEFPNTTAPPTSGG